MSAAAKLSRQRLTNCLLAAGALMASLISATPASAQSSPSAFTTGYRYDLMRRVVGQIEADPDGAGPLLYAAVRNTYDADGNLVRVEKGELASWQSETVAPASWSGFTVFSQVDTTYDVAGRKLTEAVSGSGTVYAETQNSYDAMGRPECTAVRMNHTAYGSLPASACVLGTAGSQGPDRITKNVYDAAGQLVQVRRGVGTSLEQAYATYSYTANGKQEYVIDANGNRGQFVYDGFDRLQYWRFPSTTRPGSFDGSSVASTFASAGAVNGGDYEAYGYDANGNRTSLRKRDGQMLGYAYDALNRVTTKTSPAGNVNYAYDLQGHETSAVFAADGRGVTHAYDGLGRPVSATTTMGGVSRTLSYAYDADSNRTQITWPDGVSYTSGYDGLDRMTVLNEGTSSTMVSLGYDAAGRRAGLGRASGPSTGYGYDGISRLTALNHNFGSGANESYGFGYNTAGQITSLSSSNDQYAWTANYNVSRDYQANGLNQYLAAGSAGFGYDANGNLTSDGSTTFAYDTENRLVQASGAKSASLVYDPEGRLFQTSGGSVGVTQFLYDGDALVAEYDGSGNLLRRYVHGPDVDEPLLWLEGSGTGNRRWLHADHQGSIVAISDSSGQPLAIDSYDDYGIPGTTNLGRFQYTGQAWLPELGMYYYKARIYSPTLGRFLQTDPIGYNDQINLYAYVANDPTNGRDPSGMACDQTKDACQSQPITGADEIVVTAKRVAHNIGVILNTPLTGHVSLPTSVLRAASALGISQGCAESLNIGDCSTSEKIAGLGVASLVLAVPELIAAFSPEALSTSIAFTTAKGSITNITADVSINQVTKTLVSSGFRRTVSQDGRAIVFEKGGVKYSYYASARSTGGPSLLRSANGSSTTKIRLNP